MNVKRMLIGAAFLTMCAAASASNWQQISRNPGGDILIDRDSIVRDGQIVKVWLMQFHVTGKQVPGQEPFYTEKHQWLINCTARSVAVKQSIFSGKNGNTVAQDSTQSAFNDVAPDSLGDIVLTQVCAQF